MKNTSRRFLFGKDQGSSMVFALLLLFAILALGVAGLSGAASGLTLSNNYRTGIQAMQAAESGIVHAVTAINNTGGVVKLTDISSTSAFNTAFGNSGMVNMPAPYSNVSYTVTPGTNPAATQFNMWISSVGQAPGESTRTLNARLGVTGPYTCGAIDLPTTNQISATFNGNAFSVDGNDYALGGTTPIQGSTPTLGISTRTQTDANTVVSALGSQQQDNVTGTQVPNQIASVATCTGPSVNRVTSVIVPNILGQPSPPVVTLQAGKINGNNTFGSVNSPQITYFNGDTTLKANGNSSGAGILVVNGSLTIEGNLNFTGLVIVIGSTQIGSTDETWVTGNATVYGAIWTTDLALRVGGSAAVRYSDQALTLANSIPGISSPLLPQRVSVVAWSQG